MKELSIEEKAKAYDEVLEKAKALYGSSEPMSGCRVILETLFPELKESEDEKVRKTLIAYLKKHSEAYSLEPAEINLKKYIAWLEKQGEQGSIINVPSREVILSIWDLGNEWKELTKGSISIEYGTQLEYIQKHWQESEYYLRAKQGEQRPAWSEEDEERLKSCLNIIQAKSMMGVTDTINTKWLKSLKERIGG